MNLRLIEFVLNKTLSWTFERPESDQDLRGTWSLTIIYIIFVLDFVSMTILLAWQVSLVSTVPQL